jgi:hypothetical protein
MEIHGGQRRGATFWLHQVSWQEATMATHVLPRSVAGVSVLMDWALILAGAVFAWLCWPPALS